MEQTLVIPVQYFAWLAKYPGAALTVEPRDAETCQIWFHPITA